MCHFGGVVRIHQLSLEGGTQDHLLVFVAKQTISSMIAPGPMCKSVVFGVDIDTSCSLKFLPPSLRAHPLDIHYLVSQGLRLYLYNTCLFVGCSSESVVNPPTMLYKPEGEIGIMGA